MNDSTLITMCRDVFEYILKLTRSSALQEKNIQSLSELVEARKKSQKIACSSRNLTVTKGGKGV